MTLLCIDIGGTSTKFATCRKGKLEKQSSCPTPHSLEGFYRMLDERLAYYRTEKLSGIAISSPGAVNKKTGSIEGASALPYIHGFPIRQDLEKRFGLPISMENDANCAALAESALGAGQGASSIAMLVLGTGVGGSLVINGRIHYGAHLFGGEFGFMVMNERYQTFSELGTVVNMAKRYSQIINDGKSYTGKEVLELADQGDPVALKERQVFLQSLAMGVFNIQHAFDPDRILIGGGVSQADFLLPALEAELDKLYQLVSISDLRPQLAVCQFKNEANLLGASIDFMQEHRKDEMWID
ncbi:TPA: ROK family protein [Streptococcus equi subsp. zooepidemicus]|uniref:ROK family protein n=2 Tax=Streptococcus equi TaxID=1336 RepID=A0A6M1KNE6_9STRE|nr:ROK family protein [Streptococcus equi]MCD3368469.1 ROK family protein [Streptococcus equi subsp. zooepidemicus]MCD3447137.1 ROK family protein [Streptococcus equi subsp. zooepidemicus]MCD3468158.1 ROK family protein [Streptococcus equi subsp. zooepidemicus]NGL84259.1 ROK family protein [Streptococcus equi subsp. ruminatorum]UFR19412.1 ROK family protein [Streptococcus equi subsp. zooepidemicus]